jgi:hypothetical protein
MKLLDLLTDPVRLPLALALLAAVARVLYAIVSHVVAPYPRARAAVEAVVALLPDVLRSGLQLVAVVTGRAPPILDARLPDPRADADVRRRVEILDQLRDAEAERDALAARVAELTASTEPGRLRHTVVPGGDEEPAAPAVTSRHRIARPAESGHARLWVLALLVLVGCGASASGGALKTAVVVLDGAATMRRYLCSRALDPLLGDPRAEPVTAPPSPVPPAPPAPVQPSPTAVPDASAPAGMDGGL